MFVGYCILILSSELDGSLPCTGLFTYRNAKFVIELKWHWLRLDDKKYIFWHHNAFFQTTRFFSYFDLVRRLVHESSSGQKSRCYRCGLRNTLI